MNISEIKKRMTTRQVMTLDALKWLLNPNAVGEGRSTVLAVAIIETARANPGVKIPVLPHTHDSYPTRMFPPSEMGVLESLAKKEGPEFEVDSTGYVTFSK